ncbi:hypothetical protein PIB30_061640 [Stylosanthes scabra]|uniref:Uncharacterized protein n=1 Tax=Stylosanthes scabra TaxID=79078 RepID=A0ABU6VNA3_9FABA|nr:hypothetical protein [Stylosanthes scabra]
MVTNDSVHGNMHESRNQHLNVSTQPPQTPIQPPEPPIFAESVAPKRPGAASSSNGLPSDASNSINPQTDCIPGQNTTGTTPTPASCENVNSQQDAEGSKQKKKRRSTKRPPPTGQTFIPNPDPDKPPSIYIPVEGEEHLDEDVGYHCYESEELHSIASDDDGQIYFHRVTQMHLCTWSAWS